MASAAPETVTSRYAGRRMERVEDTRLLTGRGTLVDDVTRPGMLHACFVRSPFARATINGINADAALALPGVRAVFTAADINPEVKFVGDPVALVVAESRYLAEDAAWSTSTTRRYLPSPASARR